MSYVTLFQRSPGWSHKTGLIVQTINSQELIFKESIVKIPLK